jgi:hypothetical protein
MPFYDVQIKTKEGFGANNNFTDYIFQASFQTEKPLEEMEEEKQEKIIGRYLVDKAKNPDVFDYHERHEFKVYLVYMDGERMETPVLDRELRIPTELVEEKNEREDSDLLL